MPPSGSKSSPLPRSLLLLQPTFGLQCSSTCWRFSACPATLPTSGTNPLFSAVVRQSGEPTDTGLDRPRLLLHNGPHPSAAGLHRRASPPDRLRRALLRSLRKPPLVRPRLSPATRGTRAAHQHKHPTGLPGANWEAIQKRGQTDDTVCGAYRP